MVIAHGVQPESQADVGRAGFAVTYLGLLIMVPVTYLWLHSPEAVLISAFFNGIFNPGFGLFVDGNLPG